MDRQIRKGRAPWQWLFTPLFILFFCISTTAAPDDKKLLVLVSPLPAGSWYVQWVTEVYEKALGKLGFTLAVRPCQPRLCTELAREGEVDGELMRAAIYQSLVPDLLRLEESWVPITWSALSNDKNLKLTSWSQVRNSGLRIEYLDGLPYLDSHLAPTSPATQVAKVGHWTIGLKRLVRGEVDVYIGSDEILGAYLDHPDYKGLYRAGVIERLQLYVYLNKKHEKLAGDLSSVLTEMQADGVIARISSAVLKREYLEQ